MNRSSAFFRNSILTGALLVSSAAAAEPETIFLDVVKASTTHSIDGRPAIKITFDSESRRAFAAFSARHVREFLEIRLSDEILTKPRLMEPIIGGTLQIEGGENDAAAEILVRRLSVEDSKIEVRAVGSQ